MSKIATDITLHDPPLYRQTCCNDETWIGALGSEDINVDGSCNCLASTGINAPVTMFQIRVPQILNFLQPTSRRASLFYAQFPACHFWACGPRNLMKMTQR